MSMAMRLLSVVGLTGTLWLPGAGCKQQPEPEQGARALRAKVGSGMKLSHSAVDQIETALKRSDREAIQRALANASEGLKLVSKGFPSLKVKRSPGSAQASGARARLDVAQRGISWMTRGVKAMRSGLGAWKQNPHAAQRKIRRGLRVFKIGLTTLQGSTKSSTKSACGCSSDGECQDTGGSAGGSCGGGTTPATQAQGPGTLGSTPRKAGGGCGCGSRKAARRSNNDQCL